MDTISLDLESYSEVDIKSAGLHIYARHPSTEILVAVFDDANGVWIPGQPKPARIVNHILNGGHFSAFNAAFERTMWSQIMVGRYGWPDIPLEHWHCTAAQAAAMGLPKRLDHCGLFMELKHIKDDAGHSLMMKLSKPDKKTGKRITPTPEQMQSLINYCISDVLSEKELAASLPPMSPSERKVWLIDQTVNERGIYVDTDFAHEAQDFWKEYLKRLDDRTRQLTGGIGATQVEKLTHWINKRGITCVSLAKGNIVDMLENQLPDDVRKVLLLRLEAGTTAVKKYPKFIECACSDSRIRGTLRYHGASTGRWAGTLIQPQNFPRGVLKTEAEVKLAETLVRERNHTLMRGIWGGVGKVVGSLCRSTIRPAPGNKLIAGDYEQVEARGVAWLADEAGMLGAFRNKIDVYVMMATRIFNKPPEEIDDSERFLGKGTVLGCGYEMGWLRFQRQLKEQFNVVISERLAKTCVYGYRDANPNIVNLWRKLETCFKAAIGGDMAYLKGLCFFREGDWLYIQLPSGRRIAYFKARVSGKNIEIIAPGKDGKPHREQLYGGKIAENVVSGMCRDFVVSAVDGLESALYSVILTVHDEILTETPDLPDWSDTEMLSIMGRVPKWAPNFPLAVSGWEGYFYRK